MNHRQNEKSSETKKAQKLIDKDMPSGDNSPDHEESRNQEPQPFRPDENVDNQKLYRIPHRQRITPLLRRHLFQAPSWRRRKKA
ncbi:hypothetical protein HORIV_57010 [Vreelandella olivaria]|uniref:Uncharacterized protein n=1 Tax=Vreelandella olivaria TaxID=390919 RepID=A0ABN5X3P2_9GAMM|nr:hypothetical protein HORIV_57010 [Halomonas olivaria]